MGPIVTAHPRRSVASISETHDATQRTGADRGGLSSTVPLACTVAELSPDAVGATMHLEDSVHDSNVLLSSCEIFSTSGIAATPSTNKAMANVSYSTMPAPVQAKIRQDLELKHQRFEAIRRLSRKTRSARSTSTASGTTGLSGLRSRNPTTTSELNDRLLVISTESASVNDDVFLDNDDDRRQEDEEAEAIAPKITTLIIASSTRVTTL